MSAAQHARDLGLDPPSSSNHRRRTSSSSRPMSGAYDTGIPEYPVSPSKTEREEEQRYALPSRDSGYPRHHPGDDSDYLAPLSGPSRGGRTRMDSLSSIGSSVAPGMLPNLGRSSGRRDQNNGQSSSLRRTPSHQRLGSSNAAPSSSTSNRIQPGAYQAWGLDDHEQPVPSSASSGLVGWLKTQAVPAGSSGSPTMHTEGLPPSSSFASFAPAGRVTKPPYRTRADSDVGSETALSLGGRSANQRGGSSRRKTREGSYRPGLPEWNDAGLNGDNGVVGAAEGREEDDEAGPLDDVISQSGARRRRRGYESGHSAKGRVRREMSASLSQGGRPLDRERPSSSGILLSTDRTPSRPGPGTFENLGATPGGSVGAPQMTPSRSITGSIAAGSTTQRSTAWAPLPTEGRRRGERPGSSSLYAISGRRSASALAGSSGASKDRTPLKRWVKWMASGTDKEKDRFGFSSDPVAANRSMQVTAVSILLASILVKWLAGLDGWSGKGSPPMFGDLEAQRHWMEITLHLPFRQWYYYDLEYWGLDYPPLTAYVSWLCAKIGSALPGLAPSFALDTSRGSESPALISYLRLTVLVADLLVYTPAVLLFLEQRLHGRGRRSRAMAAATVLLQPALVLVDHGHFQYNAVMLGLSAAAFALLYTSLPNPDSPQAIAATTPSVSGGAGAARGRADAAGAAGADGTTDAATAAAAEEAESEWQRRTTTLSRRVSYSYVLAAFFFTLSLGFKQMALYYAPAVFAIMLGRCIGLAGVGFERGLICFVGIGAVTILTTLVQLSPWLTSLSALGQLVHRIFPLARGIFEDKVSNVWCFLSVLPLPAHLKLKNAISVQGLARLSLATTLLAILLPCVHLGLAAAQTVRIENFLAEDGKRSSSAFDAASVSQSQTRGRGATPSIASRRSYGGGAGTSRRSRSVAAASDAGTELASLLSGNAGKEGAAISAAVSSSSIFGGAASVSGSAFGDVLDHRRPVPVASKTPSPSASVLPYALLNTSLAFFLFGFQTHEKSILLPLLPMTLLMTVKGDEWGGGAGKTDWEWAVLMNNAAVFSMWPLLKRDGLALQYVVVTLLWNWAIGSRPFAELQGERKSVIGWTSALVHLVILSLHSIEVFLPTLLPSLSSRILSRYPDLHAVLNVLLTTPIFGLTWLWAIKRQLEVGFACGVGEMGLLSGAGGGRKKDKASAAKTNKTDEVEKKDK